jgi:hypothetical protein
MFLSLMSFLTDRKRFQSSSSLKHQRNINETLSAYLRLQYVWDDVSLPRDQMLPEGEPVL